MPQVCMRAANVSNSCWILKKLPEDVSLSGKVGVSHLCEEIFEEESEWRSRNGFEKLDAKQRRAKGPKIYERGI